MFSSPFAKISKNSEKKITFSLIYLLLISVVVIRYFDRFLINDTAKGIISFEFAKTIERANEILDSWSNLSKIYAGLSLGFDFLFIIIYSLFISLIIHKLNERLWIKKPFYQVGELLIWGMFIAAILDCIENVCLIKLLIGNTEQFWPSIAYYLATGKFLLVAISLLYIISNAILLLVKKRT